jgi:hypothetical protein
MNNVFDKACQLWYNCIVALTPKKGYSDSPAGLLFFLSIREGQGVIECSDLSCHYNSGGTCTHSSPELIFDTAEHGKCLSYDADWRWGR